jgi:integrase
MKLTKPAVAKLSLPTDRPEVFYWDDALPGFGIRLRATGARRYVAQYRGPGGATRRVVLGDPRVLALDQAKERARQLLAAVRLGGDPQSEKVKARGAASFQKLAEGYLAAMASTLRAGTLDAARRHLQIHAQPLHNKHAGVIARADIAALLSDVARERGPVAANRLRATLSALWTWAIMEGALEVNPVIGTMVRPEASRERVLSDVELTAIWAGTDTSSDHDRIIRLIMLTACRRDEIGGMRWSEIDGDLLVIPSSRNKSGRPHEVPLTPLAISQLPRRRPERDLIFGNGDTGYSGWSRSKARLDSRLKLAGWGLHDLRRTVSTWLNENGTDPHIVEAVLGHVSGAAKRGVAGVYNRAAYRTQKRAALDRWAEHVALLVGQSAANLVTLGRG